MTLSDETSKGIIENVGLGSAATADVQTGSSDTTSGRALTVGAFGLGASFSSGASIRTQDGSTPTGFYGSTGDGYSEIGVSADLTTFIINRGNRPTRIHQSYSLRGTWFSYYSGSAWTYHEAYTTGNTTKASDGTLKAASPVARIVKSQEENQRDDVAEDGFSWCGCATANEEAEGVHVSRLDVGVYVLAGSTGLASSGWQLLPPMDPGGMGEFGIVEAEQGDNGELTIRLFKRKYILSDDGEMVKTKGAPIDVPLNSWIDVRLDMPEDSLWKMKVNAAAQDASGD
ncbi:phage tail protein [Enterobacter sp. RHBSTW-00175]|uniref:phage tail fiber protein n=1 Tax=Enterobacter sp. RHBSTW-00175 TaxID=2742639 RepID=UPI00217525E7|nr:phage tail protein [Enterobacter sp. RHBSTW-00175]